MLVSRVQQLDAARADASRVQQVPPLLLNRCMSDMDLLAYTLCLLRLVFSLPSWTSFFYSSWSFHVCSSSTPLRPTPHVCSPCSRCSLACTTISLFVLKNCTPEFLVNSFLGQLFSDVQQLDAARADASWAQSMQQAAERDRVALQQVCHSLS